MAGGLNESHFLFGSTPCAMGLARLRSTPASTSALKRQGAALCLAIVQVDALDLQALERVGPVDVGQQTSGTAFRRIKE
jgi:hypothetical protein